MQNNSNVAKRIRVRLSDFPTAGEGKLKRVAPSYSTAEFTFDDMLRFATEAWGPLGTATVHKWKQFNLCYFKGVLRPVPLVITNTQPFGNRLAFCSYNPDSSGRTITVNVPKDHKWLLADNDTLLHEMIHQYLFERGQNPKHASEGWRREIMRLHELITGKQIWAGRSTTKRIDGSVVRINEANADGALSLTQDVIARWPRSVGINLGKLGM
jgi:hypothetical protein